MNAKPQQKQQRPHNARDVGDGFKLHLHLVPIGATLFRVLTPRAGTSLRFSTNFFHETHHILSDTAGARFLARLLWGLAFQKQPHTLIYLGGEFLSATPFDAEPSDPIALVPAHLTALDAKNFAVLKRKMTKIGAPTTTVRWQTWGLDEALDATQESDWWEQAIYTSFADQENAAWRDMEIMRHCGGMVCYSAMPLQLKMAALSASRLAPWKWREGQMDYCELASQQKGHAWRSDGEIQIFTHYAQMRRDAAFARREVESEQGAVNCLSPDRETVQTRALEVKKRRLEPIRARRRRSQTMTNK